jgi:hypothetical protein
VDARLALAAAAQKQAEETRVQIRKLHQAAVKKGGYKKFSIELESVRLLFSPLPPFSLRFLRVVLLAESLCFTIADVRRAAQFDKLVQQHIAEVDKTLAEMKKAAGAK